MNITNKRIRSPNRQEQQTIDYFDIDEDIKKDVKEEQQPALKRVRQEPVNLNEMVDAYCCVNPVIGRCVQRKVPRRQMYSTAIGLGCSTSKRGCEQSCVLSQPLIERIASYTGFYDPDMEITADLSLTANAQSSLLLEVKKYKFRWEILSNLSSGNFKAVELLIEKAEKHYISKEYALFLATRVLRDISTYESIITIRTWPEFPHLISIINVLVRLEYISFYTKKFQSVLWSIIIGALQRAVKQSSVLIPGLTKLLEFANHQPKSENMNAFRWTRESLYQFLKTEPYVIQCPYKSDPSEINGFYEQINSAIENFQLRTVVTDLKLPRFMMDALWGWMITKTTWYVEPTQYPNDEDILNDPWWKITYDDAFKSLWSNNDKHKFDSILKDIYFTYNYKPEKTSVNFKEMLSEYNDALIMSLHFTNDDDAGIVVTRKIPNILQKYQQPYETIFLLKNKLGSLTLIERQRQKIHTFELEERNKKATIKPLYAKMDSSMHSPMATAPTTTDRKTQSNFFPVALNVEPINIGDEKYPVNNPQLLYHAAPGTSAAAAATNATKTLMSDAENVTTMKNGGLFRYKKKLPTPTEIFRYF